MHGNVLILLHYMRGRGCHFCHPSPQSLAATANWALTPRSIHQWGTNGVPEWEDVKSAMGP